MLPLVCGHGSGDLRGLAVGPERVVDGHVGGPSHRCDDEASDDVRDAAEQQHEGYAAEQEETPDEGKGFALTGHRVDEVQPVVAGPGYGHLLTDDPRRDRVRLAGDLDGNDLHLLYRRVVGNLLA